MQKSRLNSRISRNKKAAIDLGIELVVFLVVVATVFFIVYRSEKLKQKNIQEAITTLKQKSYANNILVNHYLDHDLLSCFSYTKNSAVGNLKKKGLLTFSDLINIIIKGNPQQSLQARNFISKDLSVAGEPGQLEWIDDFFQEKDEPYGQYALIWKECTEKRFNDLGLNTNNLKHVIRIYFNNEQDSISYYPTFYISKYVQLHYEFIPVGQAQIPNYYNKDDIITVRIYEVRYPNN